EAVKKLESSAIPLLASLPCYVPHLLLDTGALKTTGGRAEVPSLHKEAWLRPLRKCRGASLAGADGVVGSSHRLSEVERTTPAAPSREWDHLLDGAATPPLPRRGLRLSRRLSQTPVSSGRLVGNDKLQRRGIFQRLIRIAAMATALLTSVPSDAQIAGPQNNSAVSPQPALLNQYCITCHNQRAKTAGLALDTMDFEHVG